MTWRPDLRSQVLRDQRDAARRRGAPTPDADDPPEHFTFSEVLRLPSKRRRVVTT